MKRRQPGTRLGQFAWLCLSGILISGCGQAPSAIQTPTAGGVEGEVLRVTHLGNSGPGSLRAALAARSPRLVIFDVGGVIDLKGEDLEISSPHLTVAGETAPAPGITIIRGGIRVHSHDVELTHLRIRPGDEGPNPDDIWMPDGISVEGPAGHHVRVGHCSLTWAVDENLSATGPETGPTSHDILFHDNLIAEGLRASTHPKGRHSMGVLIHDHVSRVVLARNLFVHNDGRNPRIKQGASGLVINNVIHNPGAGAIVVGSSQSARHPGTAAEPANVVAIGNVLTPGPDSPAALALVKGSGHLHLDGNLHLRGDGAHGPIEEGSFVRMRDAGITAPGFLRLSAKATHEYVLRRAGAQPWQRDAIDQRIVDSVATRSGRIIDSQEQVGGYPVISSSQRSLEVPPRGRREWLASLVPEKYRQTVQP
jgi:pectate lyase